MAAVQGLVGLVDPEHVVEGPSLLGAAERNIGWVEDDENPGLEEDTNLEGHHMAYLENQDQAGVESPEDQSAHLAEAGNNMGTDAAET